MKSKNGKILTLIIIYEKGKFKMLTKENVFTEYKNLVTVEELMQMLRIGKNKAYELLQTGKIKSKRVGRTYMIPKQNVIDFLNN